MSEQGDAQTAPTRQDPELNLSARFQQARPRFLRTQRELLEMFALFDEGEAEITRLEREIARCKQERDVEAAALSALRTQRLALEPEVEESRRLAGQRDAIQAELDAILARATAPVG